MVVVFRLVGLQMLITVSGVERIHKSMNAYIKAISKRNEGDDKEKTLPVAHLGSSMVSHGEDFDGNSEYGQCLISEFQLGISFEGMTSDCV